jgi:hypothetical protein
MTKHPPKMTAVAMRFMLVFVLIGISACGPLEMKNVVVEKGAPHQFAAEDAGLRVSADPYTEKGRLQDAFGCDLPARGILPVLIVVENLSSGDGYVVVNDKVRLGTGGFADDREQSSDVQKSEALARAGGKLQSTSNIAVSAISWMPIVGAASLVFLPAALGAEARFRDETEIRRNLEQKQMLPKTIYRGGLQSGFFYFNVGASKSLDAAQGIQVTLRNVRTNELLPITVRMGKFQ